MIIKKTIHSDDLDKKLNGTLRAEGSAGGGSVSDATWVDADATFQTDGVVTGDVVFISGQGEFEVLSVTDETTLELDSNLAATISDTSWRITHSRLVASWSDVKHFSRDAKTGRYTLIYESDDFSVASSS